MPSIVLATLNARFHHCAFGLRYLLANMDELAAQTHLLEFTINQPALEILDAILSRRPAIVGLGVYIWNVEETTRLVADLKRVAPEVIVVLGGPEVSYEADQQHICQLADYVIAGEADLAFRDLCRKLLSSGTGASPGPVVDIQQSDRFIPAPLPRLDDLHLPYDLYTDADIAHRVIYVEASRGCPFTCEFCLSALDIPVRQFPLEVFLAAMNDLLLRGARIFKFVDRTFNLNIRVSRTILEFFLQRYQPGMFLHFELIPDRLPEALKEIIVQFPEGSLQFEVGIQTFSDDVSERINRNQDNDLVDQNLTWLRTQTKVHVHADLIVGLPGESIDCFAEGFDRLIRLEPHEIQVGILKRLRGTPIVRHDGPWQMVYSPHPPYEILRTSALAFTTVQELRRFAKYWDLIANSGNFVESTRMLWSISADEHSESSHSPFQAFRRLSNWLHDREGQSHGLALLRLVELMFEYLTKERRHDQALIAQALWRDYQRGGRSDKPHCLRPWLTNTSVSRPAAHATSLKRQSRRQGLVKDA